MNINLNYSQLYRGTEQIKSYGVSIGGKDTIVRYKFNTTDERGNKVMDKMSREETHRRELKQLNQAKHPYGMPGFD